MENKICDVRSKEDVLAAKEKVIIELFAEQNHISEELAELQYTHSKLRNIVRDEDSALYLESPYYILERYSEYMIPINKNNDTNLINWYSPMIKSARVKQNNNVSMLKPLFFELVDTSTRLHYFDRVEQYQLQGSELKKQIIIAGNLESGEKTLASGFAERYKELGMISKGQGVEIGLDGIIRDNMRINSQSVNGFDLIMILSGQEAILNSFLDRYPDFNNDFTIVAQSEQRMSAQSFKIFKCHGTHFREKYKSDEEESISEKNADIKRLMEMF